MHRILLTAVGLLFARLTAAQTPADSVLTYDECAAGLRPWHGFHWGRTATSLGLRVGMRLAVDQLIKNNVHALRPDGSDHRSFPSRHSTWAYGMAGTVTYVLGPYSPWWAVGAQAAANAVGFQRVMTRRHYPGDGLAGAGIGVTIDIVSRLIANAIFGSENMFGCWRYAENSFQPSISVSTGASFPLMSDFSGYRLGTALMTAVRYSAPVGDWAGISVSAALMSSPVKARGQAVCMRPLNSVTLGLGPCAHWHIGDGPFAICARAEGGYMANFKPRGYSVSGGSAFISVSASASVMLTRSLALGADAGMSAFSLRIGDARRKVAAPNVGIFTRATF